MKKYSLFIPLILFMPFAVSAQFDSLINKHAALQGLDPNLVRAVMVQESTYNPNATSNKDARGLMQVIPATAIQMGISPKDLYKPEPNIIAGTRYLRYLTKYFNGNLDLILAGYNAGPGAVEKYKGIPPYKETTKYVREVKIRYARLNNGESPTIKGGSRKLEQSTLMVYGSWLGSGKKGQTVQTASNQTQAAPIKVVKRVEVKDAQPQEPAANTTVFSSNRPQRSGFVQTLDENGNFVTL